MNGLQATYQQGSISNRADFNKEDFDTLIDQKGRRVLLEKALQCPCKSLSGNQQSNCKNCGGSGWIFVNPIETRMVLQSMDVMTKFKDWSEVATGTVKISTKDIDHLAFMDRITALDGEGVHNEVLHMRVKGSTAFAFSTYIIKRPIYAGLFVDTSTKLTQLIYNVDYVWENNIFVLLNPPASEDISVTVRYIHPPSFHVIEMTRETMQSFAINGGGNERLINLPLSGLARRAQYIPDAENLAQTRILNNNYNESPCANPPVPRPNIFSDEFSDVFS